MSLTTTRRQERRKGRTPNCLRTWGRGLKKIEDKVNRQVTTAYRRLFALIF
jgi:hypothetical protein